MIDVTVNKAFIAARVPPGAPYHSAPHVPDPEGSTGRDLMIRLELNPDTPTLFVVNEQVVEISHRLGQNDQVEILYPIGGG